MNKQNFSLILATSVLASVGLGSASCDTVARINFPDRDFDRAWSPGFSLPAGACGGTSGELNFGFILLDGDSLPIAPGELINPAGGAEQEVTAQSIGVELSDGAVFSYPDVLCASNEECAGPLLCGRPTSGLEESFNRCHTETEATYSVRGEPTFVSDTTKPQLFGVLYENTDSLRGILPRDLGGAYPDLTPEDEDYSTVNVPDTTQKSERATDPRSARSTALGFLRTTWVEVAQKAMSNEEGNRRTLFGMWLLQESDGTPVPLIEGQNWVSEPNQVQAIVNQYTRLEFPPTNNRAAIYTTMIETLTDPEIYGDPQYADADKHLLVFVDSHDEFRSPSRDMDAVIEAANANGEPVKIHIVQLDSARRDRDPRDDDPLLRDDFFYWQNGQTNSEGEPVACEEGDCKNFENCRVPMSYATVEGGQSNGATSISTNGVPVCMPSLDENGRIGPVEEYSQIGCETGGSYTYVKSPDALSNRMGNLPFLMDGLWTVNVSFSPLQRPALQNGEPYAVQANAQVALFDDSRTLLLSQQGSTSSTSVDDDAGDTRSVIFTEE